MGAQVIILRTLGWLFVATAILALGWDLIASVHAGEIVTTALGQQWFALHGTSLVALQSGIQRNITPWLWDFVALKALMLPGWSVFGAMGLLTLGVFRPS